jgi:8-oxo-dGTP pyrophosphatase MutT (NUDIX family)
MRPVEETVTLGSVPAEDPRPRLRRVAARAVVLSGPGRVLMLRAGSGGYKFPGGGVEPGEDLAAALVRELREECGINEVSVGDPVVTVVERREERDGEAVFEMTSHYFRCEAASEPRPGHLDLSASELALGLEPVHVGVVEAVAANDRLASSLGDREPWLTREAVVLRMLAPGVLGG